MKKIHKKNREKKLKMTLQLSLFLSLGVVLYIIESFINVFIFVPGVKLGLSNIVILIILYIYGMKEALKIGFMKVFFTSLFRSGFGLNFVLSLVGMILSVLVSGIFKKTEKFSIVGLSVVGANFHILGQIIVMSIVYRTYLLYVSYLPYMILITVISGIITGYITKEIIERVDFD